jgi:hypothetical protein
VDVGRQRDDPVAVERRQLVLARRHPQGDPPGAVARTLAAHLDLQVRAHGQPGAGADPPAGSHQRLPLAGGVALEQQDLDFTPGGLAQLQPGGQHAGGVEHQHVAGADQVGQIGHRAVRHRPAGQRRVHQQPGRVAGLDGPLGDGPLGQVVVEVGEVHGPDKPTGGHGP